MAASTASSAGVFHIRNTLRFTLKKDVTTELMERLVFGRQVLLGLLQLRVREIYCCQRNAGQRCFDVTLMTEDVYRRLVQVCQLNAEAALLKLFNFQPLWKENFRVLTVRMFNPFVESSKVEDFLERYCDGEPTYRKVYDELGIWTGLRQYRVYLRSDESGVDGYRHPPASFSIGSDRGYPFYAWQPKYCRKCFSFGHLAEGCTTMRCRDCLETGHLAKDCPNSKVCNLCGSPDHTAWRCGRQAGPRSYVAVTWHGENGEA